MYSCSLWTQLFSAEMVLDLMPSTLFCGDFTKGVVPDGPESDEEVIMIDGESVPPVLNSSRRLG
jgi:hypothetical protein